MPQPMVFMPHSWPIIFVTLASCSLHGMLCEHKLALQTNRSRPSCAVTLSQHPSTPCIIELWKNERELRGQALIGQTLISLIKKIPHNQYYLDCKTEVEFKKITQAHPLLLSSMKEKIEEVQKNNKITASIKKTLMYHLYKTIPSPQDLENVSDKTIIRYQFAIESIPQTYGILLYNPLKKHIRATAMLDDIPLLTMYRYLEPQGVPPTEKSPQENSSSEYFFPTFNHVHVDDEMLLGELIFETGIFLSALAKSIKKQE